MAMAATFTHPYRIFSTSTISNQSTTKPRHSPFTVRMSLQENAPSLAVVGVTGAVGQEFLSVLSDRDFPYRSIKMLASKRSAGKQMTFQDRSYTVEELIADSFDGVDIALFSAVCSCHPRPITPRRIKRRSPFSTEQPPPTKNSDQVLLYSSHSFIFPQSLFFPQSSVFSLSSSDFLL
ncbi:Aspartate-semialdehyde dehydrogenase [Linum perenne]